MIAVACQLACLGMSSAYAQTTVENTDPATPAASTITITGKKVGMGLMVAEDVPKARSTITAEELAKQRPTGNAYQALELMPAVNSYNYDATGLFGGGMTMRGFNSDQIGATINGVPVNDSGSFSIYPQEYVDQENTCSEFVTQGSTDVDSPQVGATGGNFGIVTCNPEDKQRVRVMQTEGQLRLHKTFIRYDSGLLSDGRSKFFISGSHAGADKWKGSGGAARDHIDIGFNYDIDRFNYVHATVLYNRAINNNILSNSLSDINSKGYYYDYASTYTGHVTPSAGVANTDTLSTATTYYKLASNPFEDVIASATAKFRIAENTDIKIIPYFWYGFGTGGTQEKVMSESGFLNPATGLLNGTKDLNGDGDTLDKVIIATSSVTRTQRPGVTLSLSKDIGDQSILGGFWYEHATHRQTAPGVSVDSTGTAADIWLRAGQIYHSDGTPYENRNWKTISTAYQFFLQDTASLMDGKVKVNVGVRTPSVKRDFTNYANDYSMSGATVANGQLYAGKTLAQTTYNVQKTYTDVLPQIGVRYQLTRDDQLFASLAKNFKAPPNYAYSPSNGNVTFTSTGAVAITGDVKPETSYNLDLGYRHQTNGINLGVTAFLVDFSNRQASSVDQLTNASILINAGKVRSHGLEFEAGNTPVNGWSFYSSLGYIKSKIENDLLVAGTSGSVYLPTTGKEMPGTPNWKAGLSGSYETNVWYARLKAKYTGSQQATLVNDEKVSAYTTLDLDMGYLLPSNSTFKRSKVTLNVSNITNRQYLNPAAQTYTTATGVNGASKQTAYYYEGAPRSASVTLSLDF